MAADDRSSEEIDKFLDSMKKCFDDVDQALTEENASIPLDYLESRLEDHFQIVNAIAIATQDDASSDLNQTVQDLLSFSQNVLQEVHTTKVQRETNGTRSSVCVPSTQAGTGGRPRYRITKEQIEILRETGMNLKRIALSLGISESTLFRRRQEFGLHESFVDVSYVDLYTVITGMLSQTPYAGESYLSGGLKAHGIFVQRYPIRELILSVEHR